MPVLGSHLSNNVPLSSEENPSSSEILIINTRSHYLDPFSSKNVSGDFRKVLVESEDLDKETVPPFKLVELDQLKLSVDQGEKDWLSIARIIKENYNKYSGFVVHNGKNDMVSTATALSFMLENLGKPVVFTGSVIPSGRLYTDLKRNIIVALLFANCKRLAEVCILFDDCLFRANRTINHYHSSFLPFDSPHFPPLATMRGTMRVHAQLIRPFPRGRFCVMENMKELVLTLKLGPSLRDELLRQAIALTDARGIVLIAYGGGNGPSRGDFMKKCIQQAQRRGIVVVVCTQNLHGFVDLGAYATGKQLQDAGAISAHDMTIDAAIMKLRYLLGTGVSQQEIRKQLNEDLRGEMTSLQSKI